MKSQLLLTFVATILAVDNGPINLDAKNFDDLVLS